MHWTRHLNHCNQVVWAIGLIEGILLSKNDQKKSWTHPEFLPGEGRELTLKDTFKGMPPIKLNLHATDIL